MILGIYVDDGILVGRNEKDMLEIIKELKKEFSVTINVKPQFFVGIEIQQTDRGIKLIQC